MNKINALFIIALISLMSCNSGQTTEKAKTPEQSGLRADGVENDGFSAEEINKMRMKIENSAIVPVEMSTAELREKIKQKWSKIHFYVENGVVVKVKTYPYAEISKRTEEFYANKDGLMLVVIEDNGEGAKGKEIQDIDKMYYFNDNKAFKEVNKEAKSEFTVRESDAEELLSEFNEYVELFKKMK